MTASIDRDQYKATADEWYEFAGDPTYGKPAYWVARHGLVVTDQVAGHEHAVTTEGGSLDEARAMFAEGTLDPNGPGGIQVRDVIEIVYGLFSGERFEVATVERRSDGDFRVVGTRGRELVLTFGQYEIVSRPTA